MASVLLTILLLAVFVYGLKQWSKKRDGKYQLLRKVITVLFGIASIFSTIVTIFGFFGVGPDEIKVIMERIKPWNTDNLPEITASPQGNEKSTSIFGDIGDIVLFGSFSADKDAPPENAPVIEWIIIQKDGDTAKLLSKNGLIYKPYEEGDKATIWVESSIRNWLNDEFYKNALHSPKFILCTEIYTNSLSFPSDKRVSADYVYLLSSEEVFSMLPNTYRVCSPTLDAAKSFRGRYLDMFSDYWYLREQGSNGYNYVASVDQNGNLTSGGSLNNGGGILIRPCVTISVSEYLSAQKS